MRGLLPTVSEADANRLKVAKRIAKGYWLKWNRGGNVFELDELISVAYLGICETEAQWDPNGTFPLRAHQCLNAARAVLSWIVASFSLVRCRSRLGDTETRGRQLKMRDAPVDVAEWSKRPDDAAERRRQILLDGIRRGVRIRLDQLADTKKQAEVVRFMLEETPMDSSTKDYYKMKARARYLHDRIREDKTMRSLASSADWVDCL